MRVNHSQTISVLVALLVQSCVPYSLDHFKQIKAHTLRSNVKEWKMKGKPAAYGYTNSTEKCWLLNTSIPSPTAGGSPIAIVMTLESSVFQERGRLYAADNGEVFWKDADKVELIEAKK